MAQKCESCGAKINETDTVCPNCGANTGNSPYKSKKKKVAIGAVISLVLIFILLMSFGFFGGLSAPVRGYYDYEGRTYYYQKGVWYAFNNEYGWFGIVPDTGLTDNYKEYYQGNTYNGSDSYDDFETSQNYIADGSIGDFNSTEATEANAAAAATEAE